ncbi:MAG: hypothetical protein RLZZ15_2601, partial [Verrucomicrobiota bacterium]
ADLAVTIDLTSAPAGKGWTASAGAPWVKFAATAGTTPATVRLSLDASALEPGLSTTDVRITGAEGTFTIPVRLLVEPLAITVLRADPRSSLVYAISEYVAPTSTTAVITSTATAYLLEIDAQTQAIKRVVTAGSSVTDLAMHDADKRIYVTNWRGGSLLAFNRSTLALERSFAMTPFAGIGYSGNDAYRLAAGGSGRLIIEPSDQWVSTVLFDTIAGKTVVTSFQREGGGQYLPGERFYLRGDNNISNASLRKFDTVGDKLTEVAANRGNLSSYYGSKTIVVTEDGARVFWSGSVYAAADLAELWSTGEIVYAASRDGRYAFGETKVYDVTARRVAYGMPVATKVSAFNTTVGRLVVQQGQRVAFFPLPAEGPLPAPVLSATTVASTTATLGWTHDALQNGFTLQRRRASDPDWTDVSTTIASTASSFVATGLLVETAYEFRLKADSPGASSTWSNIVSVTTRPAPPNVPSFNALAAGGPTSTTLTWSVTGPVDTVTVERSVSANGALVWTAVATLPGANTTYTDTGLTTSTTYFYRLKATRAGVDSAYASTRSVTLQPPSAPTFTRQPTAQTVLAGTSVTLTAAAAGNPPPTYQWFRDGVALPGATGATLTLAAPVTADAGTYRVVATNGAGFLASADITLTVVPVTSRVVNFSVLADIARSEPLTVGFTLSGGPKNVLIRGLGPTLAAVGVPNALVDPQMTLFRHAGTGTVALLANNDWYTAGNKATLLATTTRLGGLPFVADPSRDCAALILLNLDGGYSVQISPTDAAGGLALLELYDADNGTLSRLANISVLSPVGPGRILTAGFVISGSGRRTVLVRAIGPGLRAFGVVGAHGDPQLTLFRQGTPPLPVAGNNDWGGANRATILAATAGVGGFALADGSKDAVVLVDLDPGAYSAQATAADGSSGLVLIEIYEIP